MDLQTLSDRAEINDVLLQYSESLNRADWDTWMGCFTADAHLDYTTAGGIAGTKDEAVAWLAPTLSGFDMRIGRIANIVIAFAGADQAAVTSQYSMTMRIPGDTPMFIEAAGWYDDIVIRTPLGWKISNRFERIAYMKM